VDHQDSLLKARFVVANESALPRLPNPKACRDKNYLQVLLLIRNFSRSSRRYWPDRLGGA